MEQLCKIEPRTASYLLAFAEGYVSCLKDFIEEPDDDIWCSHHVDGISYDINFYKEEDSEEFMAFAYSVVDNSTADQLTDDLFTLEGI